MEPNNYNKYIKSYSQMFSRIKLMTCSVLNMHFKTVIMFLNNFTLNLPGSNGLNFVQNEMVSVSGIIVGCKTTIYCFSKLKRT